MIKADSPEEWELEQRAFQFANSPDVPKEAQKLIKDLWREFCNRDPEVLFGLVIKEMHDRRSNAQRIEIEQEGDGLSVQAAHRGWELDHLIIEATRLRKEFYNVDDKDSTITNG